jgi:hypothetical protein
MAPMIGLQPKKPPSPSVTREDEYMPIPLYGFLEGDTLGLLVLAEEGQTVLELARKLQDAANIRVARNDDVELLYNGKIVDLGLTVAQTGLQALDRFDVIWRHRV